MKRFFCFLITFCLLGTLAACTPSETKLREELSILVMQDAMDQLQSTTYYRVAIDSLEASGKNQWTASGNVNFTNSSGTTTAVLYSSTLRYDAGEKVFSTETVFGEQYQLP